jgi:hypothetical protein
MKARRYLTHRADHANAVSLRPEIDCNRPAIDFVIQFQDQKPARPWCLVGLNLSCDSFCSWTFEGLHRPWVVLEGTTAEKHFRQLPNWENRHSRVKSPNAVWPYLQPDIYSLRYEVPLIFQDDREMLGIPTAERSSFARCDLGNYP